MLKIEQTCIKGRFNLIDDDKEDEGRYIRQIAIHEVIALGTSIIKVLGGQNE